jgi:hypothetical protein
MAYDAARDRVVLYGGETAGNSTLNDTWEWNGTLWENKAPAHAPPRRVSAAMAYDGRRRRTVLFGGATAAYGHVFYGDTWEWDGTDWVDVSPATGPTPRKGATLAYDATRGTTILFAGEADDTLDDTWEWDGANWRQLHDLVIPPARTRQVMVYDAAHSQLLMLGGYSSAPLADTWAHRFGSEAVPIDQCIDVDTDGDGLVGCADPDCWARCTPLCPPLQDCDPNAPHCGDGVCSALEDHRLCPADCM